MKKALIVFLVFILVGIIFWVAWRKYSSYNTNTSPVRNSLTGTKTNESLLFKISNGMKIESSAFENGGEIPSRYTCDGKGINPELVFSEVPREAKSLALLMDDPDAPMGTWDHWVVFNMPPETKGISENSVPIGIVGKNTSGKNKYGPPCPPDREHRYFFKLYALDTMLALGAEASKQDVLKAMQGHILAEAELMGKYNRK